VEDAVCTDPQCMCKIERELFALLDRGEVTLQVDPEGAMVWVPVKRSTSGDSVVQGGADT